MGRPIDLDNLSSDDLLYLRDRPWLLEEAERLGYKIDIEAGTVEVTGDDVEDDDEEDLPNYEDLTVPALKEELAARQLSTEGNKPELVERLRADDAESASA